MPSLITRNWKKPFLSTLAKTGLVYRAAAAAKVSIGFAQESRKKDQAFDAEWGKTIERHRAAIARRWRRDFLRDLSICGEVTKAAKTAGIPFQEAYKERRENPDFAAAWDKILEQFPGPTWWHEGFLNALEETGDVRNAAAKVGVDRATIYRHRALNSRFRAAWANILIARQSGNVKRWGPKLLAGLAKFSVQEAADRAGVPSATAYRYRRKNRQFAIQWAQALKERRSTRQPTREPERINYDGCFPDGQVSLQKAARDYALSVRQLRSSITIGVLPHEKQVPPGRNRGHVKEEISVWPDDVKRLKKQPRRLRFDGRFPDGRISLRRAAREYSLSYSWLWHCVKIGKVPHKKQVAPSRNLGQGREEISVWADDVRQLKGSMEKQRPARIEGNASAPGPVAELANGQKAAPDQATTEPLAPDASATPNKRKGRRGRRRGTTTERVRVRDNEMIEDWFADQALPWEQQKYKGNKAALATAHRVKRSYASAIINAAEKAKRKINSPR